MTDLTIPAGHGICPKCHGTTRVAVDATGKPVDQAPPYPRWPQYAAQGFMECQNCGGQSMAGKARGYTKLRSPEADEGCLHEYMGITRGNCYTVYTCKHCGDRYDIDSSD